MNTKKVMAWFIILLMSLSVLGIIGSSLYGSNSNNNSKVEYNGFTFYNRNYQWETQVQGITYSLQYLPAELQNITLGIPVNSWRNNPKMYLGYVPNDTIALQPSLQSLGRVLLANGIIPQEACVKEEGCPDIPLLDCSQKAGVVMRSGKENRYTQDGQCVVIEVADIAEAQKLTERLI